MHGHLKQILAASIRSEGLPVAAEWTVADGRALVHVDEQGRVTAESHSGEEEAGRLGECSLVTLAHLLEHPVQGARATEIRERIEELR